MRSGNEEDYSNYLSGGGVYRWFGAGNAYRSICKAEAVTQDSTESDVEKEVIYNSDDQQEKKPVLMK